MKTKPDSAAKKTAAQSIRLRAEKIGLIGLGLMGMALARKLTEGGFEVVGYDLLQQRMRAFRGFGGIPASNAGCVASQCSRILLSLPDDKVVRAVVAEILPNLTRGQIIIDTSTGRPEAASAVAQQLAGKGVHYLDATISGSSSQVLAKDVVVLAGGARKTYAACMDVFAVFARKAFLLGPSGSGAKMKLVTNLVLGLNRAALAEGIFFGKKLGFRPSLVLKILRETMAYSRIMDTKGRKMTKGDFSPQAKLSQHLKDVRLILAAGARLQAELPLTKVHRKLLQRAVAAGYGALDNSAVILAYEPDNPFAARLKPKL